MKTVISFVLTFFALTCGAQEILCDYYSPQCQSKYKAYNEGAQAIQKQLAQGIMTGPVAAVKRIELVNTLYPKDGLLMTIAKQQAAMDKVFSESKLTFQQKEDITQAAATTFQYAMAERSAMIKAAAEAGNERTAARSRQQSDRQVVYVDNDYEPSNVIPTAMFLNKVGQAFSSSYNQYLIPMTTCNSWGKGTVTCY